MWTVCVEGSGGWFICTTLIPSLITGKSNFLDVFVIFLVGWGSTHPTAVEEFHMFSCKLLLVGWPHPPGRNLLYITNLNFHMFSQNLLCSACGRAVDMLVPPYFLSKICARSNSGQIVGQISLVTSQFELSDTRVGFELGLRNLEERD